MKAFKRNPWNDSFNHMNTPPNVGPGDLGLVLELTSNMEVAAFIGALNYTHHNIDTSILSREVSDGPLSINVGFGVSEELYCIYVSNNNEPKPRYRFPRKVDHVTYSVFQNRYIEEIISDEDEEVKPKRRDRRRGRDRQSIRLEKNNKPNPEELKVDALIVAKIEAKQSPSGADIFGRKIRQGSLPYQAIGAISDLIDAGGGFKNVMLGGSLALMFHGIELMTPPEDVDVIVYKPTPEQIKLIQVLRRLNLYGKYGTSKKYDSFDGRIVVGLQMNGYKLDILVEGELEIPKSHSSVKIDTISGGFLPLNPVQDIIRAKSKLSRPKDRDQIEFIINKNFNK